MTRSMLAPNRVIHEEILLHSINDVTMTVNLFNDDEKKFNVKAEDIVVMMN